MGFEFGRRVREAAGAIGARMAERARRLGRLAHAEAGRVWRDVGERLHLDAVCSVEEADAPPAANAEENLAVGPGTLAVVETMAEVLARSGYSEIRADVVGFAAPEVVRGTVRSHRPSLSARARGRPVLVDVFLPEECDLDRHLSRWHLFASAAEQMGGEFHLVVPSWLDGRAGRSWARQLTEGCGFSVGKVWELG
jgi:hypothetical protein